MACGAEARSWCGVFAEIQIGTSWVQGLCCHGEDLPIPTVQPYASRFRVAYATSIRDVAEAAATFARLRSSTLPRRPFQKVPVREAVDSMSAGPMVTRESEFQQREIIGKGLGALNGFGEGDGGLRPALGIARSRVQVIDEFIEAEDGSIRFDEFVDAVAEQVKLAERFELDPAGVEGGVGQGADRWAGDFKAQAAARFAVGAAEQNGGRMAAAGVGDIAPPDMVNPIPNREEHLVVPVHLEHVVEGTEDGVGLTGIDPGQRSGADDIHDGHGKERGADAMRADVEEVKREMIGVEPAIVEDVAAQLGGGEETPFSADGLFAGRGE